MYHVRIHNQHEVIEYLDIDDMDMKKISGKYETNI